MKRKVVQHGPSTLIISLPLKWAKRYGIKKGDDLEVDEKDKTLLVSPHVVRSEHRISADVSGLMPRLVDRFLARAYQKGYDTVQLTHNDLKLLEVIQQKVQELIGYELIEQNDKTCLIQAISQKIELNFDMALRKAFLVTKQMIESCRDCYEASDRNSLRNLYLRDLEVNRFTYFCLRQINKEQYYVGPELTHQSHVLYYLIESLEDLGDAVKRLASLLSESKKKNPEIMRLLAMMAEQYELSYSFFYAATKEKANHAYRLYLEVEEAIRDLPGKKIEKNETLSLLYLREATAVIYHFTTMRLDFIKQ